MSNKNSNKQELIIHQSSLLAGTIVASELCRSPRIHIDGCSRDFKDLKEVAEYIVYLEKLAGITK